jgi:hypothetical protein
MSTERDVDRIVLSWLRVDENVSADRIVDDVLAAVDTTSQRRSSWLARRTPTMNKFVTIGLAAAAVVVAVFIGSQLLGAPNVISPPQAPSPSPSASQPPTPRPLGGSDLGPPGTTVQAADFAEPFNFTVPEFPAADPPTPVAFIGEGTELPYQNMSLNSVTWGKVSIHDDQSLPANLCLPTGDRIDDVPATPGAVEEWLLSSTGLEVSAAETLDVDGRSALRWDIHLPEGVCDDQSEAIAQQVQPPWFAAGEDHRVYAVPTGADTILVLTWGVDFMGLSEEYGEAVNAATDDLVQSMEFGN